MTSAKFSPSVGRPEYRVEFFDEVKFFALLSELQARLGLAIDMFYGKLGREKAPSVASSNSTLLVVKKNNPFMNDVNITMPVTQAWASEAPITVPVVQVAHGSNPRANRGVARKLRALQLAGYIVDRVDGSLQNSRISQAYPTLLSGAKAGVDLGIDQRAPKNSILDVDLPIPIVPIESERTTYTHLIEHNASTDPYSPNSIRPS